MFFLGKNRVRPSRKSTKIACEPCVRSKSRCGVERPCRRCVGLDRVQLCTDRVQQLSDGVPASKPACQRCRMAKTRCDNYTPCDRCRRIGSQDDCRPLGEAKKLSGDYSRQHAEATPQVPEPESPEASITTYQLTDPYSSDIE